MDLRERCTKPRAQIVATNARFPLNRRKGGQSIVEIAIKSIGSQDLAAMVAVAAEEESLSQDSKLLLFLFIFFMT